MSEELEIRKEEIELLNMARNALENAYSPYSNLKVGAALLTKNGNTYIGCNVENASYSITSCAERNAIAAAVLSEGSTMVIESIAVVSSNMDSQYLPITPCGSCRQAIHEFSKKARVICTPVTTDEICVLTINKLLPSAYTL